MKKGDKIPEILGVDANGRKWTAQDFAGSKLVLYFYPKDGTPLCTDEACSLASGYGALLKAGYKVVGVSADSAESHRKFAEEHSLPFPLIADTELVLNKHFGVWHKQTFAAGEYMGTVRTTFIIDENGIVKDVITDVDTKNSAGQILNMNK
ncbi:MAG: peroxiredoxin [Muribaculaceae bacterium]|nr:peroxiredoxin [Muribaculaceae bacterium]